jgi:hypothetical protein
VVPLVAPDSIQFSIACEQVPHINQPIKKVEAFLMILIHAQQTAAAGR